MAAAVATTLEKQFSTIAASTRYFDLRPGPHSITIQFSLETATVDAAAQDVNSAIAAAQKRCRDHDGRPRSGRLIRPTHRFLSDSSHPKPCRFRNVNEYAETFLGRASRRFPGWPFFQGFAGQQKYAVRVQVDPNALAAPRRRINEVEQAVASANVQSAHRHPLRQGPHVCHTGDGPALRGCSLRPIIVTYRNARDSA